jgi:hypothetical protein
MSSAWGGARPNAGAKSADEKRQAEELATPSGKPSGKRKLTDLWTPKAVNGGEKETPDNRTGYEKIKGAVEGTVALITKGSSRMIVTHSPLLQRCPSPLTLSLIGSSRLCDLKWAHLLWSCAEA